MRPEEQMNIQSSGAMIIPSNLAHLGEQEMLESKCWESWIDTTLK